MTKDCFTDFWISKKNLVKDILVNFLKNHFLFAGVSEITIYKICYEIGEIKVFDKN